MFLTQQAKNQGLTRSISRDIVICLIKILEKRHDFFKESALNILSAKK